MKWGQRWGLFWGWKDGASTLSQTVTVRIINGLYVPCKSCHWYSTCVVPRGKAFPRQKEYYGTNDIYYHSNQATRAQSYYKCEDYTQRAN